MNCYGASIPASDGAETKAIGKVFGTKAKRIPLSSTKAATGHLLGASGVLETAFCLLSIRENAIPPTLNLKNPNKKDFDFVPNESRVAQIDSAMTISFGLGGQLGVVVVTR